MLTTKILHSLGLFDTRIDYLEDMGSGINITDLDPNTLKYLPQNPPHVPPHQPGWGYVGKHFCSYPTTGSFPSVILFCNGLKYTKWIRNCPETRVSTFWHSQSFCQWCHRVIYCLGGKGPFMNENISPTFFSCFQNKNILVLSLCLIL